MYGCFSLRSVTLGAGVEVIGKEAFLNCTRLTEAIFSNTEGWHIVIGTYHMETHTHAPPENARLLIEEYVFYEWVRHLSALGRGADGATPAAGRPDRQVKKEKRTPGAFSFLFLAFWGAGRP